MALSAIVFLKSEGDVSSDAALLEGELLSVEVAGVVFFVAAVIIVVFVLVAAEVGLSVLDLAPYAFHTERDGFICYRNAGCHHTSESV